MGGDKWVETLLVSYKGNDPFNLTEYRNPRQPGKPSKALVSASEPDPQAALEKVLGHSVADFKIVKTPNSRR
jgi:hypothetical protein